MSKFSISCVLIFGILSSFALIIITVANVWAANINCDSGEPCKGTSKDDMLTGTAGKDFMWGLKGKDIIRGLAGEDSEYGGSDNDILYGGTENDRLVGGNGADKICGADGNDGLLGKKGNDFIYGDNATTGLTECTAVIAGKDTIWGGDGSDIIYGGPNHGVAQRVILDESKFIERLYGGAGNDVIEGQDGYDDIFGQKGADQIHGGDGNDYLFAGQGLYSATTKTFKIVIPGVPGDKLWGGPGSDYFDCGGMASTIVQDFEPAKDKMGNCRLSPGTLNNISCSSSSGNISTCLGTNKADSMTGDSGVNDMDGKGGNDIIYGYEGGDIITGGAGDDKIYHHRDLGSQSTAPDGSKDIIDCGPGADEVWINEQSDGDVLIPNTCEIVHK